jgi:hypothetical protein
VRRGSLTEANVDVYASYCQRFTHAYSKASLSAFPCCCTHKSLRYKDYYVEQLLAPSSFGLSDGQKLNRATGGLVKKSKFDCPQFITDEAVEVHREGKTTTIDGTSQLLPNFAITQLLSRDTPVGGPPRKISNDDDRCTTRTTLSASPPGKLEVPGLLYE